MSNAWLFWLFAWAIVIAFLTLLCLIQERPPKQTFARACGWTGCVCMGVVVLGGLFLLAFGIL